MFVNELCNYENYEEEVLIERNIYALSELLERAQRSAIVVFNLHFW